MFNLKLINGRLFDPRLDKDGENKIIVNRSAVKELNMDNPIGYKLYKNGDAFYEVIGVVEDFYGSGNNSLNFVVYDTRSNNTIAVKIRDGETKNTLKEISKLWNDTYPERFFDYSFLGDNTSESYSDLKAQSGFFIFLASICIFIASMGIYGLISFTNSQRVKEIGIRKVMGASIPAIMVLILRDYILLILISNLIAFPLAYSMSKSFLQEFSYKMPIGPELFIITGLITLFFSLLISGIRTFTTASRNPADTLRIE